MKSRSFFSTVGLLTIVALLYAANVNAQARRVHLEFEGGFTYNQLYWHVEQTVVFVSGTGNPFVGSPPVTKNRTHFQLLPAIQLGLDVPLEPLKSISFEPFIGYHQMGGESSKRSNGYQDRILLRTISPGMFLNDRLFGYRVSLGIRYDAYMTRYGYYNGSASSLNNTNAYWKKDSANGIINTHCWSAGLRIGHRIWKSVSLEASGWYGLSNIGGYSYIYNYTIKTVQFRIMLNYRL